MHLVSFCIEDDPGRKVGVVNGDLLTTLEVSTISELLQLPTAELRSKCEGARGKQYRFRDVKVTPPVDGLMEVWAAGVTYKTSQIERMEESHGASDFYNLVYDAVRPELFFKSTAWSVVGDGEPVVIREDSEINVPEPELAVVLNIFGDVVGFSICNDVSSRSIEAENPLYLPQAKTYLGSCAIGFGIRPVWEIPDPMNLGIEMIITRSASVVWRGDANTGQLNRSLDELIEHLWRANGFPDGAVLSTGTCLVPPLPFSLESGDVVSIKIDHVGTLTSPVTRGRESGAWILESRNDSRLRPTVNSTRPLALADGVETIGTDLA